MDRLATRIGIIHEGRLLQELNREDLAKIRVERLEVCARDLSAASLALSAAGYKAQKNNDHLSLTQSHAINNPDQVATLLVRAGTPPTRIAVQQDDLEQHFLQLTGVQQ